MSIPEFTAEASLYRTTNRYRSSVSKIDGLPSAQSVVAAYFPGTATQAKCSECLAICAKVNVYCNVVAAFSIFFPPAAVAAFTACAAEAVLCAGGCAAPVIGSCCPKVCGFPNPLDPGEGCCDQNETCVDRYDPNSRQGCCPSDQSVCAGKCCSKGESCCGDTCCPPNYFCREGGFCSEFPSDFPNTPPPPPPINNCIFGGAPCGSECCPPGLKCCGVFNGQPDCKTSCLR